MRFFVSIMDSFFRSPEKIDSMARKKHALCNSKSSSKDFIKNLVFLVLLKVLQSVYYLCISKSFRQHKLFPVLQSFGFYLFDRQIHRREATYSIFLIALEEYCSRDSVLYFCIIYISIFLNSTAMFLGCSALTFRTIFSTPVYTKSFNNYCVLFLYTTHSKIDLMYI